MKKQLRSMKTLIGLLPIMLLSQTTIGQLSLSDYLNLPTVHVQELSNCNFEQLCTGVDTTNSIDWQIGTPSKTHFDSAYSVTNAIVTDTLTNYPLNSNMHFDLHVQNNIPHGNLIEFWHKLDSDSLLDGGFIEVSKDTGVTWVNLLEEDSLNPQMTIMSENMYSSSDSLYNGEKGFSGSISEWKKVRILIDWGYPVKASSWPLGDFQLRFKFISDNIETNKEGWMIDNLTVSQVLNSQSVVEESFLKPIIYPNPTTNNLTVQFNESTNIEGLSVSIYNALGQEISSEEVRTMSHSVSLKENAKGIYRLIIKENNRVVYNSSIVKN